MLTETDKRAAVIARDAQADGAFFYAVLTTGVFCFPSCKARPPLPENIRFFDSREAAMRAGYRPCQRCRPELAPKAERENMWVRNACRAIEAGEFDPQQAATEAGVSPAQFSRIFKNVTGLTLTAFQRALRHKQIEAILRAGAAVTEAIYASGFGSAGRFYEAADAMLGMKPTAFQQGGVGERIEFAVAPCALGLVLVAIAGRGICAILLGDEAASLRADLRQRFAHAALFESTNLGAALTEVVGLIEAPAAGHALPLDIRGTLFQRRVWEALRTIPAGRTLSYGALAAQLDLPGGARAVASAVAANKLAVAVPCHRVVAKDGGMAGYRWGKGRKIALLRREGVGSKRGLLF